MGSSVQNGGVSMLQLAERIDLLAATAFESGLDTGATILARMAALLRALQDDGAQATMQSKPEPTLYRM